jgi:hypothetical protein
LRHQANRFLFLLQVTVFLLSSLREHGLFNSLYGTQAVATSQVRRLSRHKVHTFPTATTRSRSREGKGSAPLAYASSQVRNLSRHTGQDYLKTLSAPKRGSGLSRDLRAAFFEELMDPITSLRRIHCIGDTNWFAFNSSLTFFAE